MIFSKDFKIKLNKSHKKKYFKIRLNKSHKKNYFKIAMINIL